MTRQDNTVEVVWGEALLKDNIGPTSKRPVYSVFFGHLKLIRWMFNSGPLTTTLKSAPCMRLFNPVLGIFAVNVFHVPVLLIGNGVVMPAE
jgi:hypothetical protein